ncbi:MAG: TetR/AcrR family transcriptional regulator C-terminal domain-containing protein [Actinomycetota bacterium]
MSQPPKSTTREPLTRDRVAETAVQVMDAEGYGAVTMRRIGRELGVEAMSLYNHVADKDDLVTAMIDAVFGDFALPPGDVGDWEQQIRLLARSYRAALLAHPDVIQLLAENTQPSTRMESLLPLDTALATLRSIGLSDQEVVTAYRMFGGFIIGYVMMETRGIMSLGDDIDVDAVTAVIPDELPNLKQLVPEICAPGTEADFDFGIEVMIRGLRGRVPEGRDVG